MNKLNSIDQILEKNDITKSNNDQEWVYKLLYKVERKSLKQFESIKLDQGMIQKLTCELEISMVY